MSPPHCLQSLCLSWWSGNDLQSLRYELFQRPPLRPLQGRLGLRGRGKQVRAEGWVGEPCPEPLLPVRSSHLPQGCCRVFCFLPGDMFRSFPGVEGCVRAPHSPEQSPAELVQSPRGLHGAREWDAQGSCLLKSLSSGRSLLL